jgi:hypothetical protein
VLSINCKVFRIAHTVVVSLWQPDGAKILQVLWCCRAADGGCACDLQNNSRATGKQSQPHGGIRRVVGLRALQRSRSRRSGVPPHPFSLPSLLALPFFKYEFSL